MNKLQLTPGARALVIVAHPDDETIWLGGTIARFPQVNWTIMALCRASDRDRAPKFKKICAHFGAHAIITDLEDEGRLNIKQSLVPIKKLVVGRLKNKSFDYLFTHGLTGEYGHERHIAVHLAIKQLLTGNFLHAKEVLFFNYRKTDLKPKADSNFILSLSAKELADKKKAMTDIYGFNPNGIDTKYCTKIEAFKTISNLKFKI